LTIICARPHRVKAISACFIGRPAAPAQMALEIDG